MMNTEKNAKSRPKSSTQRGTSKEQSAQEKSNIQIEQEDIMETLLTIEELAGVLKLAEQTIRRYVLNRRIPFRKIGEKAVRFRPSEIEQWVNEGGMSGYVDNSAEIAGDLFSAPSTAETTEQAITETRYEEL